jgi:hypothetical protein
MKGKKIIILLLTFVLPISIFIFLKTLGKNEFAVEPLHQEGIIETSADCELQYSAPYTVPESILKDIRWTEENNLTLYLFANSTFDELAISNQLSEKYNAKELKSYKLSNDTIVTSAPNIFIAVTLSASAKMQLQTCYFMLAANTNAVLIDQQRRIRGYYNLLEREDIDRLMVEIEIILKKY